MKTNEQILLEWNSILTDMRNSIKDKEYNKYLNKAEAIIDGHSNRMFRLKQDCIQDPAIAQQIEKYYAIVNKMWGRIEMIKEEFETAFLDLEDDLEKSDKICDKLTE